MCYGEGWVCERCGRVILLHACACEGRRRGGGCVMGRGGCVYGVGGLYYCMHVPVRAGGGGGCVMGRGGCVNGVGGLHYCMHVPVRAGGGGDVLWGGVGVCTVWECYITACMCL